MSLLGFEGPKSRDDEAVGVEPVTEDGLFEGVLEGDGPDEGSAGERLWICACGVGGEVSLEETGERGNNESGKDSESDLDLAR